MHITPQKYQYSDHQKLSGSYNILLDLCRTEVDQYQFRYTLERNIKYCRSPGLVAIIRKGIINVKPIQDTGGGGVKQLLYQTEQSRFTELSGLSVFGARLNFLETPQLCHTTICLKITYAKSVILLQQAVQDCKSLRAPIQPNRTKVKVTMFEFATLK